MNHEVRRNLEDIGLLLTAEQILPYSEMIGEALSGTDAQMEEFLVSNDLWGGAGSICDQALIDQPEMRSRLLRKLIVLGELLISEDVVNPRTAFWVSGFKQRESDGVI